MNQLLQEAVIKAELKALFNKKKALTIFDIGACDGIDAIRYSQMFPDSAIYMFEPLEDNIRLIKDNLLRYQVKNASVNKLALSDKAGLSSFYKSAGSPYANYTYEWNKSSSLLEPNMEVLQKLHPWLKFKEILEVQTDTLDNFCTSNQVWSIDFIHMDVQGAEMMVLNGATKILRNTKAIWLEVGNVESYKEQPLKNDIIRFFKKRGFRLIKDTAGKKSEGDCLFARLTVLQLISFKIRYYLFRF